MYQVPGLRLAEPKLVQVQRRESHRWHGNDMMTCHATRPESPKLGSCLEYIRSMFLPSK